MDLTEMRKIVAGLSKEDLQQFKNVIDETLIGGIDFKAFMVQVIEQKFSDGLICPRCRSKHIIKNGFNRRKVQRYLCKDCGGFVPTTKTVFANSKLSAGIWLKYAECMNQRMTLRETAKAVRVCLKTAFNMRHKILEAVKCSMDVDDLNGILEMDESFFAESFKGNHKKGNPNWKAPRVGGVSRKRGKEVHFRGISHEQVCISSAMDRNGGLVLVPVCNGRLTTSALTGLYNGKVKPQSTICTDSHNAYKKFAETIPADLIQIERGRHKKGVYHINHINSLHNKLKQWMKPLHGVATKYLTHYMYWFNWVEHNSKVSSTKRGEQLLLDSFSSRIIYTQKDVRNTKAF